MVASRPRLNTDVSAWHIGTLMGAGLLILVGVVFQLAQFGYGMLTAKDFWFVSMVAENIWNFVAMRSDLPAMGELLHFWPLLLVASGLGLLAIPHSACAARLRVSQDKDYGS